MQALTPHLPGSDFLPAQPQQGNPVVFHTAAVVPGPVPVLSSRGRSATRDLVTLAMRGQGLPLSPEMQEEGLDLLHRCRTDSALQVVLAAIEAEYKLGIRLTTQKTSDALPAPAIHGSPAGATVRQQHMLWASMLVRSVRLQALLSPPRASALPDNADRGAPAVTAQQTIRLASWLQAFHRARFEKFCGKYLRGLTSHLAQRERNAHLLTAAEHDLLVGHLVNEPGLPDGYAVTIADCWAGALEMAHTLYGTVTLSDPGPAYYLRQAFTLLYRLTIWRDQSASLRDSAAPKQQFLLDWRAAAAECLEADLTSSDRQVAAILADPIRFFEEYDQLCAGPPSDPASDWPYCEELCLYTGLPMQIARILANAWKHANRCHGDLCGADFELVYAEILNLPADALRPPMSLNDACPEAQSPLLMETIAEMQMQLMSWSLAVMTRVRLAREIAARQTKMASFAGAGSPNRRATDSLTGQAPQKSGWLL